MRMIKYKCWPERREVHLCHRCVCNGTALCVIYSHIGCAIVAGCPPVERACTILRWEFSQMTASSRFMSVEAFDLRSFVAFLSNGSSVCPIREFTLKQHIRCRHRCRRRRLKRQPATSKETLLCCVCDNQKRRKKTRKLKKKKKKIATHLLIWSLNRFYFYIERELVCCALLTYPSHWNKSLKWRKTNTRQNQRQTTQRPSPSSSSLVPYFLHTGQCVIIALLLTTYPLFWRWRLTTLRNQHNHQVNVKTVFD